VGYFNWAAVGLPPRELVESIAGSLPDIIYGDVAEIIDGARKKVADFLTTKPDNIAFVGSSTSEGVRTALNAIGLSKGDVLLTTDLEFPLVNAEALSRSLKLRVVENFEGAFDEDSFDFAGVKAALISSVNWITGYKLDLCRLYEAARELEAFLVVDAVQHAGALKLDFECLDFAAFSGYKWLLAPYGIGVLYVGERALEELEPPHLGYMHFSPSGDFWGDPDKRPNSTWSIKRGAIRYEPGGSAPWLAIYALGKTADFLNKAGLERIEKRILELRRILHEEVKKPKTYSPDDVRRWSGIFSVDFGGVKRNIEIARELKKAGFVVSARGAAGISVVRISVHYLNEEEEVKELARLLNKLGD